MSIHNNMRPHSLRRPGANDALSRAKNLAHEQAPLIEEFLARIEKQNRNRQFVDSAFPMMVARALNFMAGRSAGRKLASALSSRSRKIYSQIALFISPESDILDLGCGDGKVGELVSINKSSNVTLMDVDDFVNVLLPFFIFNGRDLPFVDGFFDHVLLLTVLHHSDDPLKLFEEALRVADKSVIIIESVYFNQVHKQVNKLLDWIYNKVLNDPEVSTPFNFLPPDAWVAFFEKNGGRVTHMRHLGMDQPLVPEWHTLYVVEKRNQENR